MDSARVLDVLKHQRSQGGQCGEAAETRIGVVGGVFDVQLAEPSQAFNAPQVGVGQDPALELE